MLGEAILPYFFNKVKLGPHLFSIWAEFYLSRLKINALERLNACAFHCRIELMNAWKEVTVVKSFVSYSGAKVGQAD